MIKSITKTLAVLIAVSTLFIVACMFLLSSCNKKNEPRKENWVCTCKHRNGLKDTTVKYPFPQQTKEVAIIGCDSKESYLQSVYGPTGTLCSLGF